MGYGEWWVDESVCGSWYELIRVVVQIWYELVWKLVRVGVSDDREMV